MCYSAQIIDQYRKFVRVWGAHLSLRDYMRVFWERRENPRVKIPKAMEALFAKPTTEEEREIKALIDRFNSDEMARVEQELFKQRKRLADAERTLATKPTKAATESKRIATGKVDWCLGRLADIRRVELQPKDSRIFPGWYAPVMVSEAGRRVIKPMRYQCRPAGKPAFYDTKYPGTYNARRDNLEGFWRDLYGYGHGIMVAQRFYENVERIDEDGKPYNVVLEFNPADGGDMLVACLWSRWTDPKGIEPDLLSFAAITDEPPAEVAAAGHDRCIVPIKPENVDAWLYPEGRPLAEMYAILDDRHRPYYEHRMAA
jgi:putative SOS response-associated peptidase YedK